jgi:hypothetical protein
VDIKPSRIQGVMAFFMAIATLSRMRPSIPVSSISGSRKSPCGHSAYAVFQDG